MLRLPRWKTMPPHYRRCLLVASLVLVPLVAFILYNVVSSHTDLCSPYTRAVKKPVIWSPVSAPATSSSSTSATPVAADGRGSDVEKLDIIRDTFLTNYNNYSTYAWGCDCLLPLTKSGWSPQPKLGTWGATILDSLSTMVVMGFHGSDGDARGQEHFRRALNFTQHINFARTKSGYVSLFEVTIRHMGSMLSTYELLGRPKEHHYLVDQAETLAKGLMAGFVNKVPFNLVNSNKGRPRSQHDLVSLAAAGTLLLEWSRLSDITGNDTYRALVEETHKTLIAAGGVEDGQKWPGLQAWQIDPTTGKHSSWLRGRGGSTITLGPGADSYYEYLVKAALLDNDLLDGHNYLSTSTQAFEAARDHLVTKSGVSNLTFLSDYSNFPIYLQSQLTCFVGPTWALLGRTLHRPEMVQLALEITESCAQTTTATASGLGSATWTFKDQQDQLKTDWLDWLSHKFDEDGYRRHGFSAVDKGYHHGPEVVEAVFYAYRITGQTFWRDIQWNIFTAMRDTLETPNGWVQWNDVNVAKSHNVSSSSQQWQDNWINQQESFLYAENFKYFYLTFASPEFYSLDRYVFNTEAHPFPRLTNASQFGSIQFNTAGKVKYEPLLEVNRQRIAKETGKSSSQERSGTKTTPTGTTSAAQPRPVGYRM